MNLSAKAAADLRGRFTDCLCPRCLALAAEREVREEVPQQSAKNPT
jgi:hypothetical protein